jgi:hypothetical protein
LDVVAEKRVHRERGIVITRIAVERFTSAEIYVAVGDLISEIVKTDITIASVIINAPLYTLRLYTIWQNVT